VLSRGAESSPFISELPIYAAAWQEAFSVKKLPLHSYSNQLIG
jgi:hypothetical protein